MGYSFQLTARVLLYAPSHRQDSTYHSLCYTSRGALAGTTNSSMGPPHEGSIRRPIAPWTNALTTELHLAPSNANFKDHKWKLRTMKCSSYLSMAWNHCNWLTTSTCGVPWTTVRYIVNRCSAANTDVCEVAFEMLNTACCSPHPSSVTSSVFMSVTESCRAGENLKRIENVWVAPSLFNLLCNRLT